MSTNRKGAEFFVGLFLLIGLGMIAVMVMVFGRVSGGMEKNYLITVEFPNATGVVKGCDVLISGSRVGSVLAPPRLVNEHYAVAVDLQISETIKIPRTSTFQIRTNGMLGDAYIDVIPPLQYTAEDFAKPGETIAGMKLGGFDELTAKGSDLVDKLNTEILTKLSVSLDSMNQRLLTEKNLKNIEDTFANLKDVTGEFTKTSKDLDAVMAKAQEAIDSVKVTMKTADASAEELRLALGDLRKTADTATKTIDSAKVLINKASNGDGTFGALVSDKQMATDLKTLIANIRRSGVLFYKDRPLAEPVPATPEAPKKKR
jgi:phospholipid/cholesterol/gamma-HCH transport system substrate-binding protein